MAQHENPPQPAHPAPTGTDMTRPAGQPHAIIAMVKRASSNALIVELKDGAGTLIGTARQKLSAGVLFGFMNGGKATYTLTLGDRTLRIDVNATTTVIEEGREIGRIVPHDGAAQLVDATGGLLAIVRAHQGKKSDEPLSHHIVSPRGDALARLDLNKRKFRLLDLNDMNWIDHEIWGFTLQNFTALKVPTAGTVLTVTAAVPAVLTDLLLAACVDFAVLPRAYVEDRCR
jgi:hypothetical protein